MNKRIVTISAGLMACCAMMSASSVFADHGSLTEREVRVLYAEVAHALNRHDVEFVLDRIADDASLETRTRSNERISVEQFSKANYRASMRRLYQGASDYNCTLKVEQIHLYNDHERAEVLYTMIERWRDRDGWQVTVTKGQTGLQRLDGKLMATEFILWVGSAHGVI